jgi:hypothetical protein
MGMPPRIVSRWRFADHGLEGFTDQWRSGKRPVCRVAATKRILVLFVAFTVATGKITAAHKTRRHRVEFLDFMNNIVAACLPRHSGM